MKTKYTKEILEPIVKISYSIAQVLRNLGLTPSGGNYKHIPELIKKFEISTSHFTGQSSNKGKTFGPKRPIEDYLVNPLRVCSNGLKKRLLREGIFQRKCYSCSNSEWLEKPIPLELEHKDGNCYNNLLENLTLLCPNCHAFTPTYRGRNRKPKQLSSALPRCLSEVLPNSAPFTEVVSKPRAQGNKIPKTCIDCFRSISRSAVRCKSCSRKASNKTKILWPSIEELTQLLSESNYTQLGIKLGVSDNAIRKRLKNYSISSV